MLFFWGGGLDEGLQPVAPHLAERGYDTFPTENN